MSFNRISAGVSGSPFGATCGVTPGDKAYCWGSNSAGQFGNGSTTSSPTPVPALEGLSVRQVSAGGSHGCAVTREYQAYCWGANSSGELGDGTTTQRVSPVPVAGGHRFRQIDVGGSHTCAVSYPDNRVYCWGANFFGQVGNGSQQLRQLTPAAVVGGLTFRQVSTGLQHTCGITTGDRVYCWGDNGQGQLGDVSESFSRTEPAPVAGTHLFTRLSAGGFHTCAITGSGRAFCWGRGRDGQIGDGKTNNRFAPRAVAGKRTFERITGGGFHSCGVTSGGKTLCWGANDLGQLGDGTTADRHAPTAVVGGLTFDRLSAGAYHTCALTANARTYCWGRNRDGIGVSSTARKVAPVLVAAP